MVSRVMKQTVHPGSRGCDMKRMPNGSYLTTSDAWRTSSAVSPCDEMIKYSPVCIRLLCQTNGPFTIRNHTGTWK